MQEKFTGLRVTREKIQPKPEHFEQDVLRLEQGVYDLERCLAGDSTSKRWQELNVDLTNEKQKLLHMKRRLAGRTPQMESWADPLP